MIRLVTAMLLWGQVADAAPKNEFAHAVRDIHARKCQVWKRSWPLWTDRMAAIDNECRGRRR